MSGNPGEYTRQYLILRNNTCGRGGQERVERHESNNGAYLAEPQTVCQVYVEDGTGDIALSQIQAMRNTNHDRRQQDIRKHSQRRS